MLLINNADPPLCEVELLFLITVMSAEALSCTIKSPVTLQIGDAVSDSSRPGVYITDITLAEPANVSVSHSTSLQKGYRY